MNQNIKCFSILLLVVLALMFVPKQAAAQQMDFQIFYDELSPYGQWVDYPQYGYVWIPDAGPDFAPYSTNGYWVLTRYGWSWVSDYQWGWAPFHYGRWDYDNYYGWLWVPDNEWGPSWVNWRRADGYYGWAPMRPGINYSVSYGRPYRSSDYWIFVRDRDFERTNLSNYYVSRNEYGRIARNSTVINTTYIDNSTNVTYITGPERVDVERVTGRTINPVPIHENSTPGQHFREGQLQIYKPQVVKDRGTSSKPAPAKVTDLKNVKRYSDKNTSTQPRTRNQENDNNLETQPAKQGRRLQENAVKQQNTRKVQEQPVQQQKSATPANANERRQQQNAVKQQNTRKEREQHVQQQKSATQVNTIEKRQQNVEEPQNNRNRMEQPVQQHRVTSPANTNENRQQQNFEKQQNIRNRNETEMPVNKPKNVTPTNRVNQELQPNTIKTQNINMRNTQPMQQSKKVIPYKRAEKLQNQNAGIPPKTKKEQAKESKNEKDKK